MNSYIQAQIQNMILMTKHFDQACDLAATKDDGIVSREEKKMLSKLHTATAKFRKEIESIG